jgi:hypothetical protein
MAISAGASAIALVATLLIKEVRHVAPEEPYRQEAAPAGEPRFAGAATGARVVTRTRGM